MQLQDKKLLLFDLDGVVWLGTDPIPGVADAINGLRQRGFQIRFLTNNASQTRKRQCEKLRSMNVEAEVDEVITAGYAAARHVYDLFGPQKVHVLGTDDLKEEMQGVGHTVVDSESETVVVGFDKEFNYKKLTAAFREIHLHKARFVASNYNAHYPAEDGLAPGIGPSVAALAYCAGRQPDLVVGKPNAAIYTIALDGTNVEPKDAVMIADLLELDIKGAQALGMETIFVLSGVDDELDIERTGITPDHTITSAAALR